MGGLNGVEEMHQHVPARARSTLAGCQAFFPRATLAIVDHDFDTQDAAALVVDLQCQIAPLGLKKRVR
jgi:hypothetical protein